MTGSTSQSHKPLHSTLCRVWAWGVFACVLAELSVIAACGGTTGREGFPSAEASVDASEEVATSVEAAVETTKDATVGGDSAADAGQFPFDATIMYADPGRLPHINLDAASMDVEAAAPAWESWPACACDSYQTDPIVGVPVGIPADAGSCSAEAMVWTQRPACDRCYRYNKENPTMNYVFPPCCDLRDAGVAAAGPKTGQPLFNLCAEVYTCVLQSACWASANGITDCICGDAGDCTSPGQPNGPCKDTIEAAFQLLSESDPDRGLAWLRTVLTDVASNGVDGIVSYTGAEPLAMLNNMNGTSTPALGSQCNWACAPESDDAGYAPPTPSVDVDGASLTKTESLLYQASPSCYACLKDTGCLDDDRGDMNNECEDLAGQTVPGGADAGAGQSRQDLCYATLKCIIGSASWGSASCLENGFGTDFSSTNSSTDNTCLIKQEDAGGCQTEEQNGLETTDPDVMTAQFNNIAFGAGVANRIFNCAFTQGCPTSCFGM